MPRQAFLPTPIGRRGSPGRASRRPFRSRLSGRGMAGRGRSPRLDRDHTRLEDPIPRRGTRSRAHPRRSRDLADVPPTVGRRARKSFRRHRQSGRAFRRAYAGTLHRDDDQQRGPANRGRSRLVDGRPISGALLRRAPVSETPRNREIFRAHSRRRGRDLCHRGPDGGGGSLPRTGLRGRFRVLQGRYREFQQIRPVSGLDWPEILSDSAREDPNSL